MNAEMTGPESRSDPGDAEMSAGMASGAPEPDPGLVEPQ